MCCGPDWRRWPRGSKEGAALREARASAAAAEAALQNCRVLQAEREQAQLRAADRLTQAQGKLYSGRVRNPKELEDAERDVAQLRRQHTQVEDALLEALITTESAAEMAASRQAELARLTAARQATHAKLLAEQSRLNERLVAEHTRQAAARGAIAPAVLHTYDTLRPRRGGRAVARVDGDTCGVCLVAIPPVKLQAARDGEALVYCENCGRVLWAE